MMIALYVDPLDNMESSWNLSVLSSRESVQRLSYPPPYPFDGKVFVSANAPHHPYGDHSAIYEVTARAMRAAGVKGAGTLMLRHDAASRMLRSGAAPPVISAVLGHADPDTTNGYMEADAGRMRACVLPLPKGAIA